jgi:hypothetical protein
MADANVTNDQEAERSNAQQERRDGAHDHHFVAGNTHVPQGKVPNAYAKGCQHGPEDEPSVDVGSSVEEANPRERTRENCANLLVLFFLEDSVGDSFVASTRNKSRSEGGRKEVAFMMSVYLYRESWNIPARYTSNILHNDLEVCKLDHRNCVECYIEQDERPLKEGIDGVRSRNAMHLVSNEEVDEGYECCEERTSKELPVLDGRGVARAQGKTANCPW